jgi:hypothetical protein
LSTLNNREDWFGITFDMIMGHFYLIKLDIYQVNKYGDVYIKYGQTTSNNIDDEQLYIIFKSDGIN